MSKIRSDVHGLYLITGGYYFRPVFPIGYSHRFANKTEYQEGDSVKARHIGGSPLATVKTEGKSEKWYSHGATCGASSVQSFKPEYDTWL